MDIFELVVYFFFILFFLLGQYLKRRKMALRQAEISLNAKQPRNAGSSTYASNAAEVSRSKSSYRSLEDIQIAPETSKIQKLGSRTSAYRKQFKSHSSLQQAIVSKVVLGTCRADEPYENSY